MRLHLASVVNEDADSVFDFRDFRGSVAEVAHSGKEHG
jgi:hypothetical protein